MDKQGDNNDAIVVTSIQAAHMVAMSDGKITVDWKDGKAVFEFTVKKSVVDAVLNKKA
jgi:hypothetical protein